jgi:hypothetical protein
VCEEVKADIFVIGEDWGRKPHNQDVENYFNAHGKKVVQIKYNPRTSSTQIKLDVLAQPRKSKTKPAKPPFDAVLGYD